MSMGHRAKVAIDATAIHGNVRTAEREREGWGVPASQFMLLMLYQNGRGDQLVEYAPHRGADHR